MARGLKCTILPFLYDVSLILRCLFLKHESLHISVAILCAFVVLSSCWCRLVYECIVVSFVDVSPAVLLLVDMPCVTLTCCVLCWYPVSPVGIPCRLLTSHAACWHPVSPVDIPCRLLTSRAACWRVSLRVLSGGGGGIRARHQDGVWRHRARHAVRSPRAPGDPGAPEPARRVAPQEPRHQVHPQPQRWGTAARCSGARLWTTAHRSSQP